MKSTGMVRGIDKMGRVVLPTYIFCDSVDDIVEYKGNKICKQCIEKLNALAEE